MTCTSESHARAKSDSVWPTLQFIGIQPDFDDDGNRADLELRNCSECSSTLARLATPDCDLVVYPADYVSPEAKAEMARTHAECLAPGGSF